MLSGGDDLILRAIRLALAAAVAFATLGPPGYRPHSDLGQNGEHALAFVLIGLAFGLAYTQRRMVTAAIAVVMIGLVEILQFWVPGRHARLIDFVVDAWRPAPASQSRPASTGASGDRDAATSVLTQKSPRATGPARIDRNGLSFVSR